MTPNLTIASRCCASEIRPDSGSWCGDSSKLPMRRSALRQTGVDVSTTRVFQAPPIQIEEA
jgi:hypothetical protein